MSNRISRPGRTPARRILHTALLVALVAPGAAFAQTAKEQELEARIAQLEAIVRQLGAQQAAASPPAAVAPPVASSAPAAPAPAKPALQSTPILPGANPGTAFTYGGFIKLDAMATDTTDGEIPDGSVGRLFYVPSAIPVGGADEGVDTDFHAQFSRFWFSADTTLDSGAKLKGYLEFDLFGGGSVLGNEVATNTHGVTVRHAYVTWNRWLAGQAWSNFQDVAALPDSVDFVGPTEGTVFVRQAQVRYTNGPWSFSVENPETTVTPFRGGTRINSDDNSLPDVTARYTVKGAKGHLGVAALVRELAFENAATGVDDSITAAAVSVSGKYAIGANDDLRGMVTVGQGLGRYLGLGITSDAALDAAGNLHTVDGVAGFIAWRHAFSPTLRSNLFWSAAQFDHDAALSGGAVTDSVQSWHANLIYSPLPRLDIGAELIWGQRTLENGADGDLRRLHTHVKYSF